MRLSLLLISLTAPRAAAFQSPQTPRPALQLHSTPPDDGTFGSDGPMMAADPEAEFAALEAMAPLVYKDLHASLNRTVTRSASRDRCWPHTVEARIPVGEMNSNRRTYSEMFLA